MPTSISLTKFLLKLNNKSIRSLGIDPGLGTLGFGVVSQFGDRLVCDTYGVIKTPTGLSIPERLVLLHNELKEKIEEYNPDIITIEKLFFGRNVTTAEMVWEARGVILYLVSSMGYTPYEIKPNEVKMAVCGYGSAEKGQVQGMVTALLSLDKRPTPDDAADALAMAIAGLSLRANDFSIPREY